MKETIEYMLNGDINERETAKKTLRHYRLVQVLILPRKYYQVFITFGLLIIGSVMFLNKNQKHPIPQQQTAIPSSASASKTNKRN